MDVIYMIAFLDKNNLIIKNVHFIQFHLCPILVSNTNS